jgi:hypothetical protein
MLVAVAWAHALGIGLSLWPAARRGGVALGAGIGATIAVLLHGIGMANLVDPWNPYIVLFWFLAFLLAVWAAIDGDRAALPVAALTGTFCAQSHVEYVPLAGALALLTAGWLAIGAWRRRRPGAAHGTGVLRWGGAAVLLGALLWVPLVLDEVRRSPGNLQIMVGQFRDGTLPAVGLWPGTRALLVNADPTRVLRGEVVGEYQNRGPVAATCVMLAMWAVAAIAAVRARRASLVRLHAVLAVGFAVGCLAMSRITGPLWFWLGMWGAILGALMIVATTWTAVALWPRRPAAVPARALAVVPRTGLAPATRPTPATRPARAAAARRGVALLVGVGVVFAGVAAAGATSAEVVDTGLSDRLSRLVPPTIDALASGELPGTGPDGTYVVTSTDPVDLGVHAIGIVDELDRRGFRVGMGPAFRSAVTEHRVIEPGEATAVVHLSVGPDIEAWRARPDATEVAHLDHRSAAERAEYDRTRDDLVAGLQAEGLDDRVHQVDMFVMGLALDPDVPMPLREKAERLMAIGLPTSIFVAPAEVPTTSG